MNKTTAKRILFKNLRVSSGVINLTNFCHRKPGERFLTNTIEITNEDIINLAKLKLGGRIEVDD